MIKIGVLGASGLVGQKALELIEFSPNFTLSEVSTSKKNLSTYISGCKAKKPLDIEAPYVLSALPAEVAAEVEPILLARGQHVFSNASTFRMKEDVPLVIPEVNLAHLALIDKQITSGKLVCNPNCMVALIAPLLAPLAGQIEHVTVVTMQAVSGAGKGYSLHDNIIPNIEGEEEKIEAELHKMLAPNAFSISVHVNRVPITYGHSCVLHMHLSEKVDPIALYKMQPNLYTLYDDPFSPQPGRDLTPFDEKIHVGRIKQKGCLLSLMGMGHNLVRGAAYGSLLNLKAFLERE